MTYDWTATPDADVPAAADPLFQHLPDTYASETNKTASMWAAGPDAPVTSPPPSPRRPG